MYIVIKFLLPVINVDNRHKRKNFHPQVVYKISRDVQLFHLFGSVHRLTLLAEITVHH